jgi:hypothetical protein
LSEPLIIKLIKAVEIKPKFGENCNHCGYCCLTEPCPIGQDLTRKTIGPCELLIQEEDQYFCKLIRNGIDVDIGQDKGCCAETQDETINRLTSR